MTPHPSEDEWCENGLSRQVGPCGRKLPLWASAFSFGNGDDGSRCVTKTWNRLYFNNLGSTLSCKEIMGVRKVLIKASRCYIRKPGQRENRGRWDGSWSECPGAPLPLATTAVLPTPLGACKAGKNLGKLPPPTILTLTSKLFFNV